jgi:hypothetical protein
MDEADEEHVDGREFDSRRNDTTPLMALVRDPQYSRGMLTSQGRTASAQYQAFLQRSKDARRSLR